MNNFWKLEKIQKENPGWRLCILGGDTTFGYTKDWKVDKSIRNFFGWRIEFFGHEDGSKDYGQRHLSTNRHATIEDAIDTIYEDYLNK